MGNEIYFIAWGAPKAEARHRTRVVQAAGRAFSRAYQPKENRENRAYLRHAAQQAVAQRQGALLDGPIELTVVCWIEQPKSKRIANVTRIKIARLIERLFPLGKPDCDNLVKPIKDACTSVVWTDDARVVSEHVHKRYTIGRPCTEVYIREMGVGEAFDPLTRSHSDPQRPTERVLLAPGIVAVESISAVMR